MAVSDKLPHHGATRLAQWPVAPLLRQSGRRPGGIDQFIDSMKPISRIGW